MPRALTLSSELDETLSNLLNKKHDYSECSKNFRSKPQLYSQTVTKNAERDTFPYMQAGLEPLTVRHPISWRVIETPYQSRLRLAAMTPERRAA